MRNLQITVPRAESGIVHRVVDAWIALWRLEWQIVDKIKVPVVSGQRGVDVATHISSYLSPISMASPSGWRSRTLCRTYAVSP